MRAAPGRKPVQRLAAQHRRRQDRTRPRCQPCPCSTPPCSAPPTLRAARHPPPAAGAYDAQDFAKAHAAELGMKTVPSLNVVFTEEKVGGRGVAAG